MRDPVALVDSARGPLLGAAITHENSTPWYAHE